MPPSLQQNHGAVCHHNARCWVTHPHNAIAKGLAWSANATPPGLQLTAYTLPSPSQAYFSPSLFHPATHTSRSTENPCCLRMLPRVIQFSRMSATTLIHSHLLIHEAASFASNSLFTGFLFRGLETLAVILFDRRDFCLFCSLTEPTLTLPLWLHGIQCSAIRTACNSFLDFFSFMSLALSPPPLPPPLPQPTDQKQ